MDGDDNGKFRLERVKALSACKNWEQNFILISIFLFGLFFQPAVDDGTEANDDSDV